MRLLVTPGGAAGGVLLQLAAIGGLLPDGALTFLAISLFALLAARVWPRARAPSPGGAIAFDVVAGQLKGHAATAEGGYGRRVGDGVQCLVIGWCNYRGGRGIGNFAGNF